MQEDIELIDKCECDHPHMRILNEGSGYYLRLRDRVLDYMAKELCIADGSVCFDRIGRCFVMAEQRFLDGPGNYGFVKLWPEEVLSHSRSDWTPNFHITWGGANDLMLHAYRPGEWERELHDYIEVVLRSRKIAQQERMQAVSW